MPDAKMSHSSGVYRNSGCTEVETLNNLAIFQGSLVLHAGQLDNALFLTHTHSCSHTHTHTQTHYLPLTRADDEEDADEEEDDSQGDEDEGEVPFIH